MKPETSYRIWQIAFRVHALIFVIIVILSACDILNSALLLGGSFVWLLIVGALQPFQKPDTKSKPKKFNVWGFPMD